MATIPTTAPGYVEQTDGVHGAAYNQLYEHVPELDESRAPYVYSRMRTDPQLTAVVQAVSLPLIRATWQVDPAGCRPEVAQRVADDLGLPLVGEDQPGAARRRGVQWAKHLGNSLRGRLIYGFYPYALEATDDGATTMLSGLYERPPWTIGDIKTDSKTGALISAQQTTAGMVGGTTPAPMPASSLLWYVREQEGSNWRGRSMLRSAYGPWLLKQEMLRVNAIGHRRHGAGHLTLVPNPGTNPTDAQQAAAAAMAQAARAGDQAGGAAPPGYSWQLSGLIGSVPDTLAFIRYLDQQMARMALAGMLDLGETPNGSRALGDTFVDLFMLALQAEGDDHAATLTADVAVRVTDWNYGEDEPAPRVIVTGVGADDAVTADALNLLLTSGALSADPALEADVRRRYGLPQSTSTSDASPIYKYDLDLGTATVNDRRKQLGLEPVDGGDVPAAAYLQALGLSPADASAQSGPLMAAMDAAGVMRRAVVASSAVGSAGPASSPGARPVHAAAPGLRRELTDVEAKAATDFVGVQSDWQSALDDLLDAWGPVTEAQRADLVAQVRATVEDGDVAALAAMGLDSQEAADLLAAHMAEVADDSATRMASEAKSQGVTVKPGTPAADRLDQVAQATAALLASGLVASAARKALQVWTPGASADDVATAVDAHLASLTDASLRDSLGPALTTAQNEGRLSTLADAPTATYVASEVLDAATCQACTEEDGHEFGSLEQASAAYANGGYVECQGGARCRGIIVAVWDD